MSSIHFCTKLGILDASFSQIFSMVLPNTSSNIITFSGDFIGNKFAFALAEKSNNLCLIFGDVKLFGDEFFFDGTFKQAKYNQEGIITWMLQKSHLIEA